MTTCTPPQRAVVNQFLCGQVKVGQGQTDPQCGTALCGYTQMGRWHEYMCQTPLGLSGQLPSVLIVVDPTAIPQAIIGLGPEVPQIHITPDPLVVPAAALALTGRLPGLITNSTLAVTGTGLGLGADIPVFVGQEWLGDSVCTDLPLAAAGSSDLVLVAAGSTDLDLDPVECR